MSEDEKSVRAIPLGVKIIDYIGEFISLVNKYETFQLFHPRLVVDLREIKRAWKTYGKANPEEYNWAKIGINFAEYDLEAWKELNTFIFDDSLFDKSFLFLESWIEKVPEKFRKDMEKSKPFFLALIDLHRNGLRYYLEATNQGMIGNYSKAIPAFEKAITYYQELFLTQLING